MSKTKKVSSIKVGPFKPVKYYEADIQASDKWIKTIVDIGREVITEQQYLNIGFNHILNNAIQNKFELSSIKKKK